MQPQNTAATAATGSGRVEVAVVQFAPSTEPSQNLHQLRERVREAAEAGAQVVVAPEYSMFAVSRLDHRVVAVAEPLTGPFVTGLAAIAADYRVHLVAGVVETTTPGENRIHNTLVALGPDGTLLTNYRKVHLYDAFGHRESEVVRPGQVADPAIFTVGELTFGLQTCFDLRFPEGCRRVAAASTRRYCCCPRSGSPGRARSSSGRRCCAPGPSRTPSTWPPPIRVRTGARGRR